MNFCGPFFVRTKSRRIDWQREKNGISVSFGFEIFQPKNGHGGRRAHFKFKLSGKADIYVVIVLKLVTLLLCHYFAIFGQK